MDNPDIIHIVVSNNSQRMQCSNLPYTGCVFILVLKMSYFITAQPMTCMTKTLTIKQSRIKSMILHVRSDAVLREEEEKMQTSTSARLHALRKIERTSTWTGLKRAKKQEYDVKAKIILTIIICPAYYYDLKAVTWNRWTSSLAPEWQ